MSENSSPVNEDVAVPVETTEPGQAEVIVNDGESTTSADDTSAVAEDSTTDLTGTTTSDEGSEDDTKKSEDTSKWIGKVKERERLKERAKAQTEIDFWKSKATGNVQPDTNAANSAVKDTKEPKLADYNDIEAYTEAKIDWKLEQRFAKEQHEQTKKTILSTYNERATEFAKTVPTFSEDVLAFAADYKDDPFPELEAIAFESKVGPAIVHYLAENRADVERILELPSYRRSIELGKIEDKFQTGSSKTVTTKITKVSKAPAPVTAEKGTSVKKVDLKDPNIDQATYRENRMKQLGRR